jgi:hypothetical protein
MSRGERFVLLGLARARSLWFRDVGQWATAASIPAEFVKCVSAEEVRAHLDGGRAFSALLLDGGLPAADRDLVAAARDAGCAVLVVDDGRTGRDWHALGAAAVLPPDLRREELLDALAGHAQMVGAADTAVGRRDDIVALPAQLGRVIAVTGPGGTGASTVAIALAQELSADGAHRPLLLADLALRADQGMLNDVRDIVPGVQELVEAHRGRHLAPDEVRAVTFSIAPRGFNLLLGLRRARYWATVQPRAFEAAFAALQRGFTTVVCDVTGDFEGEDQGGSLEVEERNLMARTAALRADAVVVVGLSGLKGLHALVRVLTELIDIGVPAARLVPVVNLAPKSPRARAEITSTLAQLTTLPAASDVALAPPVFLPARRVEPTLRDLAPIPAPLGAVVAGAVRATIERNPRRASAAEPQPQRITPGSLGVWSDEEVS